MWRCSPPAGAVRSCSWLLYGAAAEAGRPIAQRLLADLPGMNRKWFVDEITVLILRPTRRRPFLAEVMTAATSTTGSAKGLAGTYNFLSGIALNKYADQRGIDSFFNGLGQWTKDVSSSLRQVQNGFVRSYALFVLLGVVAMVGYLLMR
jgi:hypothetical protein